MDRFETLQAEFQKLVPFRIRFKDEAPEMQILNLFVMWFCPGFLTRFTTVIGSTIYFPNRAFISLTPHTAMRIMTHEVVHLLDAQKYSFPVFAATYLFPQILAVGVFLFPWLGWWALLFLLFLLPLPAPFRAHFEARAYAIDILTSSPERQEEQFEYAMMQFESWDYYKMYPFPEKAEANLRYWMDQAEKGKDPQLIRTLLLYELISEA